MFSITKVAQTQGRRNAKRGLGLVKQFVFHLFDILDKFDLAEQIEQPVLKQLVKLVFVIGLISAAIVVNLYVPTLQATPSIILIIANGFASWKSGPIPSLVGSLMAWAGLEYFFIGDRFSFDFNLGTLFRLLAFVFVGTLITYLVSSQRRYQSKIRYLAYHDHLTGLANRFLLESSLNNQLLKSRRDNSRFAIIYLDLDKFKTVNDTYGHEIGDRLLIEVARRLTSLVANNDCAARLGGDEFILMKSDLTTQKIENFITQIGRLLAEEYVLDNITLKISASIGYSVYPHDGEEIQELLSKADKDLYATKQTKRLSE